MENFSSPFYQALTAEYEPLNLPSPAPAVAHVASPSPQSSPSAPAASASVYDQSKNLQAISEADLRELSALQFEHDPKLQSEFKTVAAYVAYRVALRAGEVKQIRSGEGCYRGRR